MTYRPGDLVCVKMIADEALSNNSAYPIALTKKDSLEIGTIMSKFADWKQRERKYIRKYGQQRVWEKVKNNTKNLPFSM